MQRKEELPLYKKLLEEINAKPIEVNQRNNYGKKELNVLCFLGELNSLIYRVTFEVSPEFDNFRIRVIEKLTEEKLIFDSRVKDYDLFVEVKNLIIERYIKI